MTYSPDTGGNLAAALALLGDGPSLEELALRGDLADQADQIAELRAEKAGLALTEAGLRSELAETARQRDVLRTALSRVVEAVMRGAGDPLGDALDALEATGTGLLDLADDVTRELLAVAA